MEEFQACLPFFIYLKSYKSQNNTYIYKNKTHKSHQKNSKTWACLKNHVQSMWSERSEREPILRVEVDMTKFNRIYRNFNLQDRTTCSSTHLLFKYNQLSDQRNSLQRNIVDYTFSYLKIYCFLSTGDRCQVIYSLPRSKITHQVLTLINGFYYPVHKWLPQEI